jgi:hypothetical protein
MAQIPDVADHAHPKESFVSKYKKAIAAACGVAAMVVATGVLGEQEEVWVNAALGIATALGVYAVPNRPATPTA